MPTRKSSFKGWAGEEDAIKDTKTGTSLVVHWVRLCAPNAGGLGSIPVWGTRSHLHAITKSLHAAVKIPCAATKTRHSLNKYIYIYILKDTKIR